MSKRTDELEHAIKMMQEELIQAQFEDAAEDRRNFLLHATVEDVAYLLHQKTCHANHTDGCGFHYDWRAGNKAAALKDYLPKATKMLQVASAGTVIEILELL